MTTAFSFYKENAGEKKPARLQHNCSVKENARERKSSGFDYKSSAKIGQRPKGIGAAVEVLVVTMIIVVMLVLIMTIIFGKDIEERRVLLIQRDTTAAKALFAATDRLLGETWHSLSTQAVLDGLAGRFGKPHNFYSFNASAPPSAGPPRCDGNPSVCTPSADDMRASIAGSFLEANLPASASGTFSGRTKSIELEWNYINTLFGTDTISVLIDQRLKLSEGDTTVDSKKTAQADLDVSLDGFMRSAVSATGGATAIRSGASSLQLTQTGGREKTLARLDAVSRAIAPAGDIGLLLKLLPRWSASGSTLRLAYDADATLVDGQLIGKSGLLDCSGTLIEESEQERYNKFSGSMEAANPDRLNSYVENPRALLAGMIDAAGSGWNPNHKRGSTVVIGRDIIGLMLVARADLPRDVSLFDPSTNIRLGIDSLVASFEEAKAGGLEGELMVKRALQSYFQGTIVDIDSILERAAEWDRCRPVEPATGMAWPVEGPILACYGDASCGGGSPPDVQDWSHGIDIYAPAGAPVRAALGGTVTGAFSFPNAIALRHVDSRGRAFATLYTGVIPRQGMSEASQGDIIGDVAADAVPKVHFRLLSPGQPLASVNPCLWLGCGPATPERAQFAEIPEIPNIASGRDYAIFLSDKNSGRMITASDSFCGPDDRAYKGWRRLSYGFESADGQQFSVFPAFSGTVMNSPDESPAEDGCGEEVWVDSGDFIAIYSNVESSIQNGEKVSPTEAGAPLGVSSIKVQCGTRPHIKVVFARKSLEVPEPAARTVEELNACGLKTACGEGITSGFRCDIGGSCTTLPEVPGAPPFSLRTETLKRDFYCAALPWEAVGGAAGGPRFWRLHEARSEWSREPAELSFGISDSLDALTCGSGTFDWASPADMSCAGGSPSLCAAAGSRASEQIPGIREVGDGQGAGSLTCQTVHVESFDVEVDTDRQASPVLARYIQLYDGRTISKFCSQGEENSDWLCCRGIGQRLRCRQWDEDALKAGKLRCADPIGGCGFTD